MTEANDLSHDPVNIYEFEALAKEHLPKASYDYIAGAATDEITLRRTRAVFDAISLRPRMLIDVAEVDTSTTVLGHTLQHPIMIDPAGAHGRVHPEAELATARAAGAEGALMVLSAGSSYTMEQVAREATGPLWFQQYLYKDRERTLEMAHRAQDAGFSALCVTLDDQVKSKRERNLRNKQAGLEVKDYAQEMRLAAPRGPRDARDTSATWKNLERLVSSIALPLVVKGIMTGEDARLCPEHGVKGLIVSNHGARQLDSTFASVEVLPEAAEAVDGKAEVYLDGGIRRGSDVVKALALGARAVLMGRPYFWGLAVDGENGARRVIRMLRDELEMTMTMCGSPNIAAVDRSLLALSPRV